MGASHGTQIATGLPRPRCPGAPCRRRANGAGPGGRFSVAVEQLLQNCSVVVLFVFCRIKQRQTAIPLRKFVELLQCLVCGLRCQFFQIFLAKLAPLLRMRVNPLAQLVRGRHISEPRIQSGDFLRQSPGPKPINQHPGAILRRRHFVDAFDGDRHARCILTLMEAQRRSPQTTCPRPGRNVEAEIRTVYPLSCILIHCDRDPQRLRRRTPKERR